MFVVFFRTILLYILIIFSLRLMGKRQLGELQPSELVITILISNIASLPIEDTGIPLMAGAVPILTLVSFEILISVISLKSIRFRKFISGNAKIVIQNGVIDQKALRELRFSVDDLMEELRAKSIFALQDVQLAIVETSGVVSVFKKTELEAVTPQQLGLTVENTSPPVLVISDGNFLEGGMALCGVNQTWIEQVLAGKKLSVSDIFIMTLDSAQSVYIVQKQRGSA